MIAEIIILIIALILFIISVFLFSGKGKWLIAGYNTVSKEERKNMMRESYAKLSVLFAWFAQLCFV